MFQGKIVDAAISKFRPGTLKRRIGRALPPVGKSPSKPLGRSRELAGVTRKAQSEVPFGAWSERGAGGEPHPRFVDQAHGKSPGVGCSLHGKQEVKRPLRQREAAAPGRRERAAYDLA